MRRRAALGKVVLGLFGSLWACVSCARPRPRPREARLVDAARRLEEDLARLAQRSNSEQGIPMFLVCENLVRGGPPAHPDRREGTELAAKLHEEAGTFTRLRPEAAEADVPKLVEVLAERDFGINLKPSRP